MPTPTLSVAAIRTAAAEYDQLLAATRFAIATGQWQPHLDALEKALHEAASVGGKTRTASNIERILAQRTPSLMLAQAMAIRALTTGRLGNLRARAERMDFIDWLFTHPLALSEFAAALKPQDNLDRALDIWCDIWVADPGGRETFLNLAIAVALVFDAPVRINLAVYGLDPEKMVDSAALDAYQLEVAPLERYTFYRDAAQRGKLRTNIADMAPYELVWVVDAPVPTSELVWAQRKIGFSRRSWDQAYSMIRYRMDKASGRTNIYTQYTLAEILKEGGVCADQAYFAAVTAKANGIPGMVISGEGERGGHAWFGYKASDKEWNLEAGRYTSDNYVAGTSVDPQTRDRIKEHELKILADPQRRTKGWQTSERMVQLAGLFRRDPALAQLALETSVALTPRCFAGWVRLLEVRAIQNPAPADWQKEVQTVRTKFRDYPDLIEKVNAIELAYLKTSGSVELVRQAVERQTRRLEDRSDSRTDLILDSLDREVDLADKAGDKKKALRLYRRAMSDAGNSLVKFNGMAPRYYQWGKRNGLGSEVVRDIKGSFDDIRYDPGDMFSMEAYLSTLRSVVGFLEQESLTRDADRLKRNAAKMQKNIDIMKDRQGGNETK